jgi:GMP synthase (glutamine-hydrolysing)
MSLSVPHIMVIDPGVKTPEIDTFNNIAAISSIPCSYHLPALHGFDSFPAGFDAVRGVIILGSAASVYENLPWQRPLEDWLRPVIDRGIPVLGCCYGHQMLACMLGGTVGYVNEEKLKLKGVRRVRILENDLFQVGETRLIVTHAEMVKTLPPNSRILARSDEIAIDGFMHENKPVFGFQSHPEATKVFLKSHEMLDDHAVSSLSNGHDIIRRFVHKAAGVTAKYSLR